MERFRAPDIALMSSSTIKMSSPIGTVYSVKTTAERKYFRMEKEAREYVKENPPADKFKNFALGKLSRNALFHDPKQGYYVKGDYEQPVNITLQPSTVADFEPWDQKAWFEL